MNRGDNNVVNERFFLILLLIIFSISCMSLILYNDYDDDGTCLTCSISTGTNG